jgi:hypothetical protein
MAINSTISVNQTICGCDGGLTISTFNGSPPYQYSIDNGITYKPFGIFSNLCQGNYVVLVTDISGNSSTNFVTINPPQNPITYTIYLNTTSQVTSSSPSQNSVSYTTSVSVFPELQSGTTISFKLSHSNLVKSSPNLNSVSATTNSTLIIDSNPISATTSGFTTGSTYNSIPGCQNQTLYLRTYNEEWSNLTYTLGTNFQLTTTNILYKNEFVDCYVGTSEHNFSISNLSISGCSCCNVITS